MGNIKQRQEEEIDKHSRRNEIKSSEQRTKKSE
jgi:hypothetical protein